MLYADHYLGKVGIGVTSPLFFLAQDGNKYVVKVQNNPLGPKVLVNEFLAAEFGKILGLCFPPSDLFFISQKVIDESDDLRQLSILSGIHFASKYLDVVDYVKKRNLFNAANLPEMAGILLFDHLFHNADRTYNWKNLLLAKEDLECKIYAIDNSHLFRSGRWTIDSLNSRVSQIVIYCRLSFGHMLRDQLSATDFQPYLDRVKNISDSQIETIVHQVPYEWLPDQKESDALIQFIKTRRNMSEQICNEILRYVPRSRGGFRRLGGKKHSPTYPPGVEGSRLGNCRNKKKDDRAFPRSSEKSNL